MMQLSMANYPINGAKFHKERQMSQIHNPIRSGTYQQSPTEPRAKFMMQLSVANSMAQAHLKL